MSENTQLPQERIYTAVEARGYTEGYSRESLAARQALKMVEELAEVFAYLYPVNATNGLQDLQHELDDLMARAGSIARTLFDAHTQYGLWGGGKFEIELADVVIPAMVAAQSLDYDLVSLAVTKATNDIKRGVRKS